MTDGELRLCYIKGENRAYFTSLPLDEQWGDDWNDAPYEHNAGPPCEPSGREDDLPGWRVVSCFFDVDLVTPSRGGPASGCSVEDINNLAVPWLRPMDGRDGPTIWAGCTFDDFRKVIDYAGGKVYLEAPSPQPGFRFRMPTGWPSKWMPLPPHPDASV